MLNPVGFGWFGLLYTGFPVFRGMLPNQPFMQKLSPTWWTTSGSKKAILPLRQRVPAEHKPSIRQTPPIIRLKFLGLVALLGLDQLTRCRIAFDRDNTNKQIKANPHLVRASARVAL